MERLSFKSGFAYNATEAAIHMARYQLAAPYCQDRRVLDVACGEGYGSLALKMLGAASVEGVDSSLDAINTARKLFGSTGVNYRTGDACKIDEMFDKEEFDLVISLETIEHLTDPARFLAGLKRVAKPGAVIIVTCPNDNWYYPNTDQSNPFHVRKYSFAAFRELTSSVLGNDAVWGYGVPMIGFGNVTDGELSVRDRLLGQAMMLDFSRQASAITLPQRQYADVGPKNCSYFVGIWGGAGEQLHSAAMVPISMDQYAQIVAWEVSSKSPQDLALLESEHRQLSEAGKELDAKLKAAIAENAALHTEHAALTRNLTTLDERKANLENELARASAHAAHEHAKTLAIELERERERKALEESKLAVADQLARGLKALEESKLAAADQLARELEALEGSKLAVADQLARERQASENGRLALMLDLERERALTEDLKLAGARHASEAGAQQARADAAESEVSRLCAALDSERGKLVQQIDQIGIEAAQHRVQAIALTREFELMQERNRSISADAAAKDERLRAAQAELEALHATTERYRVQALALGHELEIITQRGAAMAGYPNGPVPGVVTMGVKDALKASARYRVRKLARRMKPMMSERMVGLARRTAHRLKI